MNVLSQIDESPAPNRYLIFYKQYVTSLPTYYYIDGSQVDYEDPNQVLDNSIRTITNCYEKCVFNPSCLAIRFQTSVFPFGCFHIFDLSKPKPCIQNNNGICAKVPSKHKLINLSYFIYNFNFHEKLLKKVLPTDYQLKIYHQINNTVLD